MFIALKYLHIKFFIHGGLIALETLTNMAASHAVTLV